MCNLITHFGRSTVKSDPAHLLLGPLLSEYNVLIVYTGWRCAGLMLNEISLTGFQRIIFFWRFKLLAGPRRMQLRVCPHYTSALTASIVGVIKNITVTYAEMFIGGDYVFTLTNFVGVTINAVASAMYVAARCRKQPQESGVEVVARKMESTVLSVPAVQDKKQAG
ncbi:hypothetical protein X801_04638 [Opisthorchis viverrini]|uniref:Sugar phosphate transporter domain-containing protein n=1 Tax=Opisthorchis viverrini TaxID=6198 RepID=A0A1S8WYK6_OPIVI|nr:hypothetical protein X801_04638 [Opisthorchis viverrini]